MLINIIIIVCVIFFIFFFLCMPGASTLEGRSPFWGVNFAHRGLHNADKSTPENSLAAFTAAVDGGYGIELDIQLSKDGEVVVFHDDDLLRVCGVQGRVDSYTLEELKGFSLHGTSQKIPLLSEVLELVNMEVPLIIELKTGPRNKELCKRAWNILMRYDGDFCIESFDPRIVRWFKKNLPGILRGQLAAPPKVLNAGIGGFVVGNMLGNFLGRPQFIAYKEGKYPFLVRICRRLCMRVVWTVTPSETPATDPARIKLIESDNDAVIFEHYTPDSVYKDPPVSYENPEEEEYRF